MLDADKNNAGSDGMFLLSEHLLAKGVVFESEWNDDDGQTKPNDWQNSDAQNWCSIQLAKYFTPAEQGGMLEVSKNDPTVSSPYLYSFPWNASSLSNEKLFFLSVQELADYVGDYGRAPGLKATFADGSAGVWWLRSPSAYDYGFSGVVLLGGVVGIRSVLSDWAARPAFNINLNSVLFTSAAVGGKISAAFGGGSGGEAAGSISKISTTTTNEWKFTLKDDTRNSFNAKLSGSSTVTPGESISIEYSGATTGNNEYVSAMLTDASGNALYYGRLVNTSDAASGTVSMAIPADLAAGSYTLKVFSEQYNGDKQTDYASDFIDIDLTVLYVITYTVTFDPNGGSGTMVPQTFTEGVAQNLTPNTFTREGFTFIGWNTAADGSGTSFADGASVTASGNATLYAQWQKNAATVYTVTVSNDGNGTGTAVPSSGVTGTEVELTATPNSGYRFKEWQVVTGGVTVTDNKLMIGTANVEVKAIFELIPAATYTITFDPNGGSGMMAPQTFTEGVAQNLTLNTFIREGFTFIGWNTMADGSGNSFVDGASVTASSNATLYAQWKAVPVVTPLTITKQPTDQFVVEGQRAEFSVEAAGDGLTYQWYINRNDGRGWRELDGAIGTAYVTSVTDLECDGFQYGCLITDQYGNILKSDVAVLHVSKVPVLPETGDSSTPMLWLAMSILSMAGILLLRKKAYSR